jgi:hypothetical protein
LRTSTVPVDEPLPAAGDWDVGAAGADEVCVPLLQAAARTAAAASGPPIRTASDAFLDENSLIISYAFPFKRNILRQANGPHY